MKKQIFAIHGFLGQSSDWDELKSSLPETVQWTTPDLFSGTPNLSEMAFDEVIESLTNQCMEVMNQGPTLILGYSLGGRLAMHMYSNLLLNPFAESSFSGAFLSAGVGEYDTAVHEQRLVWEQEWAEKFMTQNWEELIADWSSMELFSTSLGAPLRDENSYSRETLAHSLTEWSPCVHEEDQVKEVLRSAKAHFFVGEKDRKYCEMHLAAEKQYGTKNLHKIARRGHRLLFKPEAALVEALGKLIEAT